MGLWRLIGVALWANELFFVPAYLSSLLCSFTLLGYCSRPFDSSPGAQTSPHDVYHSNYQTLSSAQSAVCCLPNNFITTPLPRPPNPAAGSHPASFGPTSIDQMDTNPEESAVLRGFWSKLIHMQKVAMPSVGFCFCLW